MANIQTLHERASEAIINDQQDRAVEIYKEILNENPADEIALSQLMDLYYDTNKELYYLTRANLNVVQNKLEHAINDCKKAINTNPESLEANVKLARLYKATNKNLRAIDAFSRVLEINQEDFDTYVELSDLYLIENSAPSAVQVLQKGMEIFSSKKQAFLQNMLSRVYFDLSDYENALEMAVDEGLKIKILLQKGDNEGAKKILDAIKPEKLAKEQKANYYSLLAQYCYNEEKLDEALEAVDKYVEISTPDAVSFQMKALIYASKGDEFQSAYNWGFCNKVRGKLEEAIVEFMHAYNLKPGDKDNLIELANLYEKTGEKFTAIEFWQKIYEVDNDENAKNILGNFYFEQGDYKLAQKYGKMKEATAKNQAPTEEDEGLIGKIMKMFNR